MSKMYIEVDFNTMQQDEKERVRINTVVESELLGKIFPGQEVVLYAPNDMQVDGHIEMDKDTDGREWWYGVLDWSTRRDNITDES